MLMLEIFVTYATDEPVWAFLYFYIGAWATTTIVHSISQSRLVNITHNHPQTKIEENDERVTNSS
jgi:hypothetical protein